MKDPYLYEDVPVLINNYGIKNQSVLDMIESNKVIAKLMTVDNLLERDTVTDFSYMKKVHYHLFGDIYPFAGENRKISVEKGEKVLSGSSVDYSSPNMIEIAGKTTIRKMDSLQWNKMEIDEQTKELSKLIAALWQTHPFREGNTRTTMIFACHYALQHGFSLDRTIFTKNARYTRDALVVSSIGIYSEPQYFEKIMKESITNGDKNYFKKKAINLCIKPSAKVIKSLQKINRYYGRNVAPEEIQQKWKIRNKLNNQELELFKLIGKEIDSNQFRRSKDLEL